MYQIVDFKYSWFTVNYTFIKLLEEEDGDEGEEGEKQVVSAGSLCFALIDRNVKAHSKPGPLSL